MTGSGVYLFDENTAVNLFDTFIKIFFGPLNRTDIVVFITGKPKAFSRAWLQKIFYSAAFRLLSTRAKFSLIYNKNLWDEAASVSGPGATLGATGSIRRALPEMFEKLAIRSVLDIPCGDFNWMRHVDMKNIDYTGADIVDDLIKKNTQHFASNNRKFRVLDIVNNILPAVDLIICRDGLVHLSDREIIKAVKNIKKSGSTYLLATNFSQKKCNTKIGDDRWRTLNFEKPPFNFPEPLMRITEKEAAPAFGEKSLCLWLIENI